MSTALLHHATTTGAKRLSRRDYALLRFVGEGGLATLGQLHTRYWSQSTTTKTCYRRLTQLVRAGYLERQFVRVRKTSELVFTLTKAGARLYSKAQRQHLVVGLPAQHEIKQQLLAQDTRIALERRLAERGATLAGWVNERGLRREAARQLHIANRTYTLSRVLAELPDGRAIIEEADGQSYEVEVEIDGQYWGKMLMAKLSKFAHSGKPVLYVATAERAQRVAQALVEVEAPGNIRLMILEE